MELKNTKEINDNSLMITMSLPVIPESCWGLVYGLLAIYRLLKIGRHRQGTGLIMMMLSATWCGHGIDLTMMTPG